MIALALVYCLASATREGIITITKSAVVERNYETAGAWWVRQVRKHRIRGTVSKLQFTT